MSLKFSGRKLHVVFHQKRRKLFKRLEEQGQVEEGQKFFEEAWRKETNDRLLKGQTRRNAEKHARYAALSLLDDAFPFDETLREAHSSKQIQHAQKMKYEKRLAALKAGKRVKDMDEKARQKKTIERLEYVKQELEGKGKTKLIQDIQFARDNLHLIGNSTDIETWMIKPSEAPSASAWGMLMYAVDNPNAFQQTVNKQIAESDKTRALQKEIESLRAQLGQGEKGKGLSGTDNVKGNIKDSLAKINNDLSEAAE